MAPFNHTQGKAIGLQVGAINAGSSILQGIQLGGLFNQVERASGLQLGPLNLCGGTRSEGRLTGLQLGLINISRGPLRGIQIGLLNFSGERNRFFPLLRFGWAQLPEQIKPEDELEEKDGNDESAPDSGLDIIAE
jgi:hypothetical protein